MLPLFSLDSRVANDISEYDPAKYRVSIVPSSVTGTLAFHLGEPITVKWQAPHKHSRKDWIGLYRVSLPVLLNSYGNADARLCEGGCQQVYLGDQDIVDGDVAPRA